MSAGLEQFHSRYVYRVLRPNEDPTKDIKCSDPLSKRTLGQHVATGLKLPSRYISTSANLNDARKWMTTANRKHSGQYRNKRHTIVKVDVELLKSKYHNLTEKSFDLSNPSNREKYLTTGVQKSYASAYSEVVFSGVIPVEAVSIVCQASPVLAIKTQNRSIVSKPLQTSVVNLSPETFLSVYNQETPSVPDTESDSTISTESTPSSPPITHLYDGANDVVKNVSITPTVPQKKPAQRSVRKNPTTRNKIRKPIRYQPPSPLQNLVRIILFLSS